MNRAWTLHEAILYGQGVERTFLCPVHGDSRPSASLNIAKQVWYCYSCGATGGLTGEDALIEPDYEEMKKWFEQKTEESREYSESWLARWDAAGVHPYWADRVGEGAAKHFRLGYDPDSNSGTYPLRTGTGTVLGVVRRALGGDGPKYLYPRGLDIGQHLFNYDGDARRTVVLCEGALDAIALWNVGVHAMAIYGARLGPAQIRLIERLEPDYIVTAYDRDDAGWRAHMDTERAFKHCYVEQMTWPRGWGKDVGEIGEEKLTEVVNGLASPDLSCVGSSTWRSPASTPTVPRIRIQRSRSTQTHGRLSILRTSA